MRFASIYHSSNDTPDLRPYFNDLRSGHFGKRAIKFQVQDFVHFWISFVARVCSFFRLVCAAYVELKAFV